MKNEHTVKLDGKPQAGAVPFMAISVGLVVANIYYVQPLLGLLAGAFQISVAAAGVIAMTTQLGSALGMALLVPLGDSTERRSLISRLIVVEAICLAVASLAPSAMMFTVASFGVGIAASAVHVFVPFAAHLAQPGQRGKVVGIVLSGLLMGILLARTVSGFLGAHFGWRVVYIAAATTMIALLGLVPRFLPRDLPSIRLPYRELLRSVLTLAKQHPTLREAALVGACLFCAFSAFWTALAFLLETAPYHFGSETAGEFGLVGAAGAIGALVVGRLADRYSPRTFVILATLVVLGSFCLLAALGTHMIWLIVATITLDFGVQAGHVANQSRIYALDERARSRVNTFYMSCYFLGGALGSVGAGFSWQVGKWNGVCLFAMGATLIGLISLTVGSLSNRREQEARPATF